MQVVALADALYAIALAAFLAGVAGALVAWWVGDLQQGVADFVMRRLRPPTAAQLQVLARVMRKRAAQLEIQAEKQLQLVKK